MLDLFLQISSHRFLGSYDNCNVRVLGDLFVRCVVYPPNPDVRVEDDHFKITQSSSATLS